MRIAFSTTIYNNLYPPSTTIYNNLYPPDDAGENFGTFHLTTSDHVQYLASN
jgi:hypothetical protein